jgi:hypothetical protein
MTTTYAVGQWNFKLQLPSARSALGLASSISARRAKMFARFILFTGLRGLTAYGAQASIQWTLKRYTWDQRLESYFLPKLKEPVERLKSYLVPHRARLIAHISPQMSYVKQAFIWWNSPKIEQHVDSKHLYTVIYGASLILASTCISKLIVGGSFFDALCSGIIIRIGLTARVLI